MAKGLLVIGDRRPRLRDELAHGLLEIPFVAHILEQLVGQVWLRGVQIEHRLLGRREDLVAHLGVVNGRCRLLMDIILVIGDEDVGEWVARFGFVEDGGGGGIIHEVGLVVADAGVHFLRELLHRALGIDVVIHYNGAYGEHADGEDARALGEEVGEYDEEDDESRDGVEFLVGGHGGVGEDLPPGGEEDIWIFCPKVGAVVVYTSGAAGALSSFIGGILGG